MYSLTIIGDPRAKNKTGRARLVVASDHDGRDAKRTREIQAIYILFLSGPSYSYTSSSYSSFDLSFSEFSFERDVSLPTTLKSPVSLNSVDEPGILYAGFHDGDDKREKRKTREKNIYNTSSDD